jgi:catechol 2,3-dioxygenase-like lactoylglutathione lyase family enzyme
MIRGIHHVQITVPKGAEAMARAFYCDVLNLTEIAKPESLQGRGGLWVQVGDRAVHIGTEEGFDRLTTKAHIAYEVDDLAFWREKLVEAGLTVETGIPIPGYDRFEFRDPFGNRVEMIMPLKSE